MVKKIWDTFILVLLGGLSLINCSGFSAVIDSNGKTRLILVALTVIYVFLKVHGVTRLKKKDILHVIAFIAVYGGVSFFNGEGFMGFEFLSYYLVIYIVSNMPMDKRQLFLINISYCALGIGLLAIINFSTVLSGWNSNSLSIIAIQYLLIFIATFDYNKNSSKLTKIIFFGMILVYIVWLEPLESRGAQLCAVIATVLSFRIEIIDNLVSKKMFLWIILLMPFIIAIFTVLVSNIPIADDINRWSIQTFKKPLFNGRDEIWYDSFMKILENPILGTGFINSGYFHNSAVACLSAYGIAGYALFISVFYKILKKALDYKYDVVIMKLIWMFAILMFEQSTENTLFQCGSMITPPYIIMGIILARMKFLESSRLTQER